MPGCRDCRRVFATAELRRLPKGGYRCKEQLACRRRRAEAARQLRLRLHPEPEGAA